MMLSAEALTKRGPFVAIPIPGKLWFLDVREAETILGYGTHYDHEYSEEVLKLAIKLDHRMTFFQVGGMDGNLQLVSITLNKDNFPERYSELYQIRADALDISVRIDAVGDRPTDMHVVIIDNVLDMHLGDSDLLGLITTRVNPERDFRHDCIYLSRATHQSLPWKN